jgi:hypothetical protein
VGYDPVIPKELDMKKRYVIRKNPYLFYCSFF